jgi:hypothetical protein
MWKKCLPAASWKGVVLDIARVLPWHSAVGVDLAEAYSEDSTSKYLALERKIGCGCVGARPERFYINTSRQWIIYVGKCQ